MDLFKNYSSSKKIAVVLFIIFCMFLLHCLYNRKELLDIQKTKEKNSDLQEAFGGSDKVKFSMFYVDWCPHCTSAKPHFESLMKGNNKSINGKQIDYQMVDCEKNPKLAENNDVEGYPTFVLESNGKKNKYEGPRNKRGFLDYLREMLS